MITTEDTTSIVLSIISQAALVPCSDHLSSNSFQRLLPSLNHLSSRILRNQRLWAISQRLEKSMVNLMKVMKFSLLRVVIRRMKLTHKAILSYLQVWLLVSLILLKGCHRKWHRQMHLRGIRWLVNRWMRSSLKKEAINHQQEFMMIHIMQVLQVKR